MVPPHSPAKTARVWRALRIESAEIDLDLPDQLSSTLDDFSPVAVEDLAGPPLPPGGLWDPTFPPPPDPPPARLAWRVFFSSVRDRERAAAAVRSQHFTLAVFEEDVPDENWAARSQQQLTSIQAGAFIVAPPWDIPANLAEESTLIIIEPSRGFGTGHHESTRLCLRALSSVDVRGHRVLDVGTGSGVLAMAAAFRGAHHVAAIDVDPDAIEAARSSLAMNAGSWPINWQVGDFRTSDLASRHWQVVMANLTGGMLRTSATRIRELLAPDGRLIVSGFDESERPEVEAAFNLQTTDTYIEAGWVGLLLTS